LYPVKTSIETFLKLFILFYFFERERASKDESRWGGAEGEERQNPKQAPHSAPCRAGHGA